MPMEFMFGRPLSPEELKMLREQIESMDDITVIDDDVRGIVERNEDGVVPIPTRPRHRLICLH
jgi:hypothetical protein